MHRNVKPGEPTNNRTLSPRESQIADLVASGCKNSEIGQRLGLTTGTVKVYLANVFRKTGVRSRLQLALMAIKAKDFESAAPSFHLPGR